MSSISSSSSCSGSYLSVVHSYGLSAEVCSDLARENAFSALVMTGAIQHDLENELLRGRKSAIPSYFKNGLYVSLSALKLALIENVTEVSNFIIRFYKDNRLKKLDHLTTTLKLSALHVAVIHNRVEAVRLLLEAGVDVNIRDFRKWTALHHAALHDDSIMIEILRKSEADEKLYTDTGSTFSEINGLCNPMPVPSSAPTNLMTVSESGKEHVLTHGDFFHLTGAVYRQECLVMRDRMLADWRTKTLPHAIFPFISNFYDAYLAMRANPPMHVLKFCRKDLAGKPLSPGYGLFAARNYAASEMISEYSGRMTLNLVSSPYALSENLDASEVGNAGRQINDGFPNVTMLRMVRGILRRVFITSAAVPHGDQFCWSYGKHRVKAGPYIELRPLELRSFIREHSADLSKPLAAFIKFGETHEVTLEEAIKAEQFKYILETPTVVYNMILDGTIDRTQADLFLGVAHKVEMLPGKTKTQDAEIKDLLSRIAFETIAFKGRIKAYLPKLAETYFKYMQELPTRVGIHNALLLAEYVNKLLLVSAFPECEPLLSNPSEKEEGVLLMDRMWQIIQEKVEKQISEIS